MITLLNTRAASMKRLQQFYDVAITDTPDCAGPLLDLVDAKIIKIPDPAKAPQGSMIPGKLWEPGQSKSIAAAFRLIHEFTQQRENIHA